MVFMHSSLVTVVSFILLRSPEMVLEGKKQMQKARLKTMYIDMIQNIKKKKKKKKKATTHIGISDYQKARQHNTFLGTFWQ